MIPIEISFDDETFKPGFIIDLVMIKGDFGDFPSLKLETIDGEILYSYQCTIKPKPKELVWKEYR